MSYTIYLDTNDDGDFRDYDDRRIMVSYQPRVVSSDVRLWVKRGRTGGILAYYRGDWGESVAEGGRRVEVALPWSELGVNFGGVTRMYVESDRNDRAPNSGDIQWSPASILGPVILGLLLIGASVAFWQVKKRKEKVCPSGAQ